MEIRRPNSFARAICLVSQQRQQVDVCVFVCFTSCTFDRVPPPFGSGVLEIRQKYGQIAGSRWGGTEGC